jgi:hypothetical protein
VQRAEDADTRDAVAVRPVAPILVTVRDGAAARDDGRMKSSGTGAYRRTDKRIAELADEWALASTHECSRGRHHCALKDLRLVARSACIATDVPRSPAPAVAREQRAQRRVQREVTNP